ncbi:acyl desaturase [Zymobacter palmae]|uniref:Acyl desaturase n=1 Tax=Zymobacter palmae TaxID=33074 RepID=A0A348HE66_9GAMM|nr:acyl desaturase [Zymobacter palmae]
MVRSSPAQRHTAAEHALDVASSASTVVMGVPLSKWVQTETADPPARSTDGPRSFEGLGKSALQCFQQLSADIIQGTDAINAVVFRCFRRRFLRPFAVVSYQRFGLVVVDLQTITYGIWQVIFALDQQLARCVILAFFFRRIVDDVIGTAGAFMNATARQTLDDLVIFNSDFDNVVDLDTSILQRISLRNVARETVEQEAVDAVRMRNAFLNQCDDQIIGDQLPFGHDLFYLTAQLGTRLDRSTQHVARGNLRNVIVLADELSLSAFACARSAQQDQTHESGLLKIGLR